MAEDKIRHEDIIESDIFRDATQSAERFDAQLQDLIGTITRVGAEAAKNLNGNPTTLKQMQQQAEAINDINAAEIALTEAQKQRILVAETLANIRAEELKKKEEIKRASQAEIQKQKELNKINRQATDEYGKLSAKHRELVREAKNLAVAYGAESKEAKAAASAANQLDRQLKTIDASLGQHQRNVGNYASAWGGVVTGFKNLLGGLGIGIGVAAVKDFFVDSIKSFADAEKNANALAFALNNVGGEGEAAFIKLQEQSAKLQASGGVFSDDEITKAQTQLVNYGLLSDEVEKLMPKILDLATVQGVDLATATDTVIKGINGQTKGLKTVGLGFEDTGSKAENYNIILEKLTKFEGASAEAATTTEGRYKVLMNRFDDLKEDIGSFLIDEGYRFTQYWDVLTGSLDAATMAMNDYRRQFNKTLDPASKKTLEDILKMGAIVDKSGNTLFTAKQVQIGQIDKNILAMRKIISDMTKDGTSGFEVAKIKAIEDQIATFQKVKDDLLRDQNTATLDERVGYDKETTKKNADDWQKEWEAAIKSVNDAADAANKDEEKRAADRIKWQKHQHKLWIQDQKDKEARELAEYLKKKKKDEDAKKKRQEELDYLISLEEAFTDAYFKGVDRRLSAKEKALQDESTLIDDELQRQSERQLAGADNTYSILQEKKAENIAKQAELDEQRRKVEKAKEFSELFVEFTKAYAKDGSIDAAAKAFTQTIAVRAIADAISGSFATGVEDFKGKGTGTSDSNLIRFSAGESVVTAKGTEETAGLVTMVNKDGFEGAKKWAFDNIFIPELSGALGSDAVIQSNTGDNLYQSAIINGLLQVKKAVEDKPESGLNYNQAERIFEEKIKRAGIVTFKRHKRF